MDDENGPARVRRDSLGHAADQYVGEPTATTEDPTPTPINPEPTRVRAAVGGMIRPITMMPALSTTIPARTKVVQCPYLRR
jgi:hypothetical protein